MEKGVESMFCTPLYRYSGVCHLGRDLPARPPLEGGKVGGWRKTTLLLLAGSNIYRLSILNTQNADIFLSII